MITKNMIESGIKDRTITFIVDPNMGRGTVCKIGDSWFYFGGHEAEEINPDEYLKCVPMEDVVDEVLRTLEDFLICEDFVDEYLYYEDVLAPWS